MDMRNMLVELQAAGRKTEMAFLSLGDIFPELMTVRKNKDSDALSEKINFLSNECSNFSSASDNFWTGRETVYEPMLEKLNEKISMLSDLNKDVQVIKDCSEEMELLSLNAMVISIKSGAKGRAFSSITESLKKLSSSMIENSSRLVEEENSLLRNIQSLEDIISELSHSQKKALDSCKTGYSSMQEVLQSIEEPIPEIKKNAEEVWSFISKDMETIQMQDIIKQSADQVVLCLREFKDYASLSETNTERKRDILTFDLQLCRIALQILEDISAKLKDCTGIFRTDWDKVLEILDTVEKKRQGYVDSFMAGGSGDSSISARFETILSGVQGIIDEFFKYLNTQKSLARACKLIKTKSRDISLVFTNLLPVINSLQHVRVLQKIEIAKNDAISSVRNSANDMDSFIGRSKETIEAMSDLLSDFLVESDKLLSDFVNEITETGELAEKLKVVVSDFFSDLKEAQVEIGRALKNFSVFPSGFGEKCESVRKHLSSLITASDIYSGLAASLRNEIESLSALQRQEIEMAGLPSWDLKDDAFKSIIDKFTITLHKQYAGNITGISVESGMGSGEVTFF